MPLPAAALPIQPIISVRPHRPKRIIRTRKNKRSMKHMKQSNPNLRPLPHSTEPITQQHFLKLALLNTQSLNNKALILNEFITDDNLDFLCITETWHNHLDYYSLNQATPPGYTYIDQPRPTGKGGGVASIHKKDLKIITISTPPLTPSKPLLLNCLVLLPWLLQLFIALPSPIHHFTFCPSPW